jgi:hypothetical protein
MAKPTNNDEAVVRAVVEKLKKPVLAWLEEGGSVDDEEDSLENLFQALSGAFDWDGYQLARRLEDRFCWSPDARLVEILSDAEHHRYRAHKDAVAAWVAANGATPKFKVGDRVRYRSFHHGPQEGEITHVDAAQLRYTVFVAALGHVRKGQGVHGSILEEEQLSLAPETGGAK